MKNVVENYFKRILTKFVKPIYIEKEIVDIEIVVDRHGHKPFDRTGLVHKPGEHTMNFERRIKDLAEKSLALRKSLDITGEDAKSLAGNLDRIAQIDGELKFWRMMLRLGEAETAHTKAQLLHIVATELARGADDEWSGRSNDIRRSAHDGFRRAATDWLVSIDRDLLT